MLISGGLALWIARLAAKKIINFYRIPSLSAYHRKNELSQLTVFLNDIIKLRRGAHIIQNLQYISETE